MHKNWIVHFLTCGELALHLLEHRVLSSGLSSAGQGLWGGAGEHGGHIRDILQAHTECADQLFHKVEGVWSDFSIRHSAALFECHRVAFRQALLELPQNLRKEMRERWETKRQGWMVNQFLSIYHEG